MYKINEFAKITGLPTSTLRYYDKENILKPTLRQENNSYRYYSKEEYEKANFLSLLRKHHFSISEIKDILMTISDFDELSYYLIEKRHQLKLEIDQIEEQIQSLDTFISEVQSQPLQQQYTHTFVEIAQQPYLYKEFSGEYHEMGREVDVLYSAAKADANGPLFLLDEAMDEECAYQIGLPVKREINDPNVQMSTLPKQKGIQVQHIGAYTNIGDAYKYLIDYVNTHQLQTEEQFIIRFIKGQGKIFKGNTNKYLTEVILLLTDEKGHEG
ncbi:MerR family transcriptional regulator [Isobaculum melis]|uniref:DNA-binding transcriptional regulator, MerR family n=1 Tax=Isobaculum melis TaxID=142588 RepID=A0A1H9PRW2_9LACT|nr:MerR family transcriptional regulator [Isobaculum melis]SER50954.1 DNA-binding transcriptional regulator, MerR family [Isobaculum melis]